MSTVEKSGNVSRANLRATSAINAKEEEDDEALEPSTAQEYHQSGVTARESTGIEDFGEVLSGEDLEEEEDRNDDDDKDTTTEVGSREGSAGHALSALENEEEAKMEAGRGVRPLEYKKIRPEYSEKFRPGMVHTIIEETVKEILADKTYADEEVQGWITEICKSINGKAKELSFPRYKLITHVTIGEVRGQGATAASKCVWDEDSDYFSSYSFTTNSLFCNAIVYGIYYY